MCVCVWRQHPWMGGAKIALMGLACGSSVSQRHQQYLTRLRQKQASKVRLQQKQASKARLQQSTAAHTSPGHSSGLAAWQGYTLRWGNWLAKALWGNSTHSHKVAWPALGAWNKHDVPVYKCLHSLKRRERAVTACPPTQRVARAPPGVCVSVGSSVS